MENLIIDNAYLVILLPFWICLIIIGGRFFSVYVNKFLIYFLTVFSSFLGCFFCGFSLLNLKTPIEQSFSFLKINDFSISVGLHIDKLSLIIALTLFLVSFFVQIFSISFMKNESKNYRFFALLNIFNFAMASLLFSPNLIQLYIFWELVGVISYLLIGFEYKNIVKSDASKRVFLINRVGDTALLGGIILTSYFMYSYAGNLSFTTLSFEDMNGISTLLYAYTSTWQYYLICILFIIAAAVKSAQFPFYNWLQDAMEAKLPVSALLHSATLVILGVFLLIRLLPFFTLEVNILKIILILGAITALICSILASVETHPKKVLAYSTSANLGLMFLTVGILNVKAALILLIAHAFIKSMLFLSLDEKNTYVGYISFLIGALSLAGILFSGFVAKEFIYAALNCLTLKVFFGLISFLTAFYIIRLSLIMMKDEKLFKRINYAQILPILFLLVLNIVFYFYIRTKIEYQIAEPFYIAVVGWVLVYFLYQKDLLLKFQNTPKLLEYFYNRFLPKVYDYLTNWMNYIDINVFSNYKPVVWCAKMKVNCINWVEKNLMDGSVNLITNTSKFISEFDKKSQTGNVQVYNSYAFIITTVIISCVIIAYTIMLSQFN